MASRHRWHLLVFLSTILGFSNVTSQGLYTRSLSSFEIVVPQKTTNTGTFVSHHLDHHHHPIEHPHLRTRRSTESQAPVVHYRLPVDGVVRQLDLWPNRRLLAPGARVERWRSDGNSTRTPSSPNCHFHGVVGDVTDSMVAVSACGGLSGLIRLPSGDFWLEPKRSATPLGEEHPHVLFRRSAVTVPTRKRKRKKKRKHERNCGTREPDRSSESRLEWRYHTGPLEVQARGKSRKARWRRSVSRERHVEALLVADSSMMTFHQDGDVETYLLTILNLVSALYREPSIGHPVNVAVVRVLLLEDEQAQRGLDVSVNASSTLDSFCRWQADLNMEDDADPNHHDVGILVTRADICTQSNAPCSTLGVAHVAGMCLPHKSCNVNEDNGITLAHTIAHELGHNFGMYHDTEKTGCNRREGATLHVMTPSFEADTVEVAWSTCSRRDITTFLERGLGQCLEDEPGANEFSFPDLPPGAMYDAEHQCRLQFGVKTATVCTPLEEICSRLWCDVNGTCTTLLRPAAPGTHCGKHKWCLGQQCVEVGERPPPVPGGWGAWGAWSPCSRPCGAGVSTLERRCDNPAPASGGRFCVGERRRHRVCNTQPCPEGAPSFRAQQCTEHDGDLYQGKKHTWLPYFDAQDPCELYCADANDTLLVPWGVAKDGTGCLLGAKDMCISGVCRRVGCDWQVGSNATEDTCGVCRGDGSRCETLRGLYTRRDGSGYKEIAVVPAGARNVLIEEVGNSRNFIGIGSATSGKFFLNGKRQITIGGEYEIAGTPALYERERDNEKVRIPGPLKESILIYLIFRGRYRNFGLRYEYTVLRAQSSAQPQFEWALSDWSPCSVTCGGGVQWTRPVCRERGPSAQVQPAHACADEKPAQPKSRTCNTHRCPAQWWAGPWQLCTATCQSLAINGTRTRTVMCVDASDSALPDTECVDSTRPREVEICPNLYPCHGVLESKGPGWLTGRWRACVPACGRGVRTRTVTCVHEECEAHDKPHDIEPCRAHRHCRQLAERGP